MQSEVLLRQFRIFIAEDFEPFRQFIRSVLRERSEYQLVGEASDGLEAVQRIEELRPDLILLDIGLPSLNGIEVAKRAAAKVRHAKILFISQESSLEVIEEASRVGGHGYVHKLRAQSDLLPAIEAVLNDKRYFGKGKESTSGAATQPPHRHEVLFCSDNTAFLDGLTTFVVAALSAGNAAIVAVSEANGKRLALTLRAGGVDIEEAIRWGTYIPVSVSELLSTFIVNDWPDADRFSRAVHYLITRAANGTTSGRRPVVAWGECATTLWAQGNEEAAIRLEHLLDELSRNHQIDMLCLYPLLPGREDSDAFKRLCAEHSAVHSR